MLIVYGCYLTNGMCWYGVGDALSIEIPQVMYQRALNLCGVSTVSVKVTYTQQTRGGALHCESPVLTIYLNGFHITLMPLVLTVAHMDLDKNILFF